jgi:hypothetical protein
VGWFYDQANGFVWMGNNFNDGVGNSSYWVGGTPLLSPKEKR